MTNDRQTTNNKTQTLSDTIYPQTIPKKIITTIASDPEKESIRMYVKYSRVNEDLGWKVPLALVWDYNDVIKIRGLEKLIKAIKHKKVIEIGGGNGYLAYLMAHYAKHVDTFEGWSPYSVIYNNYIFPEVVRKRLSLNYIIKYITEKDLEYLGKYDVGVYSRLDKHKEILEMLSKVSEKVIWVTFCNVKEKKTVDINLDVCVFDLDEENFFYKNG
jgi:hypothetical protein